MSEIPDLVLSLNTGALKTNNRDNLLTVVTPAPTCRTGSLTYQTLIELFQPPPRRFNYAVVFHEHSFAPYRIPSVRFSRVTKIISAAVEAYSATTEWRPIPRALRFSSGCAFSDLRQ